MEWPLALRKGAWTCEEDDLLTKCIQQHGEGKWHQVPSKAGLNRCRKSCRLRWLNYLKPEIKRGEFSADEVDLIIRLHKLLGNRWSLISGRLPGRTPNDVKNFWNTHIRKKKRKLEEEEEEETKIINKTNIIKPQPLKLFSKNLYPTTNICEVNLLPNSAHAACMMIPTNQSNNNDNNSNNGFNNLKETTNICEVNLLPNSAHAACMMIPTNQSNNNDNNSNNGFNNLKETTDLIIEEEMWRNIDFSMDLELWDLFSTEEHAIVGCENL